MCSLGSAGIESSAVGTVMCIVCVRPLHRLSIFEFYSISLRKTHTLVVQGG